MKSQVPAAARRILGVAALAVVWGAAAAPATAQRPTSVPGLGALAFPVSCTAAARGAFVRGVLLLHLFEYPFAATAFREAERIDPDCAMAYWGEAMTFNHPVWDEQDEDAGRAALGKLAPTPEARAARARTPRERAYLDAAAALYGDGPKARRDTLYAEAMLGVSRANPTDDQARLFYALALLGLSQGVRSESTYARAAAIADSVFARSPDDPGAAHYLIHAVDDPAHAAGGLDAARALARTATLADHAQHMTSHIFVALGRWDDAARANEIAQHLVNDARRRAGLPPLYCRHYNVWLAYAYAQQGRLAAARLVTERCRTQAAGEGGRGESGAVDEQTLLAMWSQYLFATGDWTGALAQWTADPGATLGARTTYWFTQGCLAARRHDLAAARAARDAFAQVERETDAWAASAPAGGDRQEPARARVLEAELDGLIAIEAGEAERGIARLREATRAEDSMPYTFGPPFVNQPSHELLGAELARLGRSADAETEFRRALERAPRRTSALLGLARAAAAAGDAGAAGAAYAELAGIWRRADPDLSGAVEARAYLREHVKKGVSP